METTFDVSGYTVSTPVTPVGSGRFGSVSSLNMFGRPLPGLASEMRVKSMSDIHQQVLKEKNEAMNLAASTEMLNKL